MTVEAMPSTRGPTAYRFYIDARRHDRMSSLWQQRSQP